MKKILISIKPKYVAEILSHRKTLEIRKSFPKCKLPCEVYIYCTKENAKHFIDNKIYNAMMRGKVVAKFTLNKVEEMARSQFSIRWTKTLHADELYERSRLTPTEMSNYLGVENGYAWHIDNLVIFDKPKELKEFKHPITFCPLLRDSNFVPSFCKDHCEHNKDPERLDVYCDRMEKDWKPLTKAPQSWCYCEVNE